MKAAMSIRRCMSTLAVLIVSVALAPASYAQNSRACLALPDRTGFSRSL